MPLSCLVVDDSDHFLEVARGLLEREGITVVGVASTSAEALHQVEELRPQVVLVDIDLGEESGFDLAEQLETLRNGQPSSVILISAYAEMDFVDMIGASAAVAFLSKSALSGRAVREIVASGTPER